MPGTSSSNPISSIATTGAQIASGPVGWASLGASVLGGIFSAKSLKKQNRAQIAAAQKQMDFQERMSSTAYQRSAKDLEAAGLNRILALGSSASSPGGAQPNIVNEAIPAINTALQLARTKAEISNIEQATRTSAWDASLKKSQAGLVESQTEKTGKESVNLSVTKRQLEATIRNTLTQNEILQLDKQLKTLAIPELQATNDLWDWLNNASAGELSKAFAGLSGPMVKLIMQFLRK